MPFLAAAPLVASAAASAAGAAATAGTVAAVSLPALGTVAGLSLPALAAGGTAAGAGLSLGTALTIGSTLLTGISALTGSNAQRSAAEGQQRMLDSEAAQADVNAGQQRASSQRAAIEQRRRGSIATSNALAAAAAGGGSVSDPTIQTIFDRIGDETDYRAMTALYEGEDAARGLETQANLKRFEGASTRTAGGTTANTTLLSGGAAIGKTLLEKYG